MILKTTAALSASRLRNLSKLVRRNMKKYFIYLLLLSLIGKTSKKRSCCFYSVVWWLCVILIDLFRFIFYLLCADSGQPRSVSAHQPKQIIPPDTQVEINTSTTLIRLQQRTCITVHRYILQYVMWCNMISRQPQELPQIVPHHVI